jgi:predicted nucleic acid-binding protein
MEKNPKIKSLIESLIDDGVAATCITVDLEAGYSVQHPNYVARVLKARSEFMTTFPVTELAAARAREVQVLMAERGLHRAAGAFDLLTAAIAEVHHATVLHYDADFEHIASVTGQRQMWVVPRGAID